MAFKPAFGELYKKQSFWTQIHLSKTQNRKLFLGGAATVGRDTPPGLPHAPPPRRLELGVPRILFLGNDPCTERINDSSRICVEDNVSICSFPVTTTATEEEEKEFIFNTKQQTNMRKH